MNDKHPTIETQRALTWWNETRTDDEREMLALKYNRKPNELTGDQIHHLFTEFLSVWTKYLQNAIIRS